MYEKYEGQIKKKNINKIKFITDEIFINKDKK